MNCSETLTSIQQWIEDWRPKGKTISDLDLKQTDEELLEDYAWLVVNLEKYSDMEDGITFSINGKCLSESEANQMKHKLEKKLADKIRDLDLFKLVADGKACSKLNVSKPILG